MTSPASRGTGWRRVTSIAAVSRAQRGRLGRCAGLQPGPGVRVGHVDGAGVEAGPLGDGRQAGGRGPERAAHGAVQGQLRLRRAADLAADPVAVPVQVQAEPGAGAEVSQRDRAGPGQRGDAQHELRAAGDLVHLVPPARALGHDVVQPVRAERPGRRLEAVVEPGLDRLRPRHREVGRQRRRPVPADQEGDGRAGQQRGQPVRRQRRQAAEQFVVAGDGPQQRRGQPPGRRGVRRRPARGHLERLGADRGGRISGHTE